METREFKDLTIQDAFMFAAVMSDMEIYRKVLELALRIPISEVHIQTEKTIAYHSQYHGVCLDVYTSDPFVRHLQKTIDNIKHGMEKWHRHIASYFLYLLSGFS